MKMTRVLAVATYCTVESTSSNSGLLFEKAHQRDSLLLDPSLLFRTTLVRTTCSSRISVKESDHEAVLPKKQGRYMPVVIWATTAREKLK